MEFIDQEFNMYPTGFCPIKPEPRSPLQCNGIEADMLYSVGVYGLKVTPYQKFVEVNRQIEARIRLIAGFCTLGWLKLGVGLLSHTLGRPMLIGHLLLVARLLPVT